MKDIAHMAKVVAAECDRREEALFDLAEAYDRYREFMQEIEPEALVARRLINAICKAIGLPPRCEIEEDAPVRLGDEIVEQERSMEAVNDGFDRLAKSIESIPAAGPKPTAVEGYAAWLARQPKPGEAPASNEELATLEARIKQKELTLARTGNEHLKHVAREDIKHLQRRAAQLRQGVTGIMEG